MKYLILLLLMVGCKGNTKYPVYSYRERVVINNGFYNNCYGDIVRDDGENTSEVGIRNVSCFRYENWVSGPEYTIFINKSEISQYSPDND